MSGYFEQYGAGERRREKVIRWLIISAVVLTIAAVGGYFSLRTFPARRSVSAFLAALRAGDYHSAYRMWGCERPCRDYSFDKFIEDWGRGSEFANASKASIEKTSFCKTGVIVTLRSPAGNDVALWYERRNQTLGFSPWPVCVERIPAPPVADQPVPMPH